MDAFARSAELREKMAQECGLPIGAIWHAINQYNIQMERNRVKDASLTVINKIQP